MSTLPYLQLLWGCYVAIGCIFIYTVYCIVQYLYVVMPLFYLSCMYNTLWIRNFQWLIFFVYIFLSMLSGDFLLCQTFWSKYLWIFLAIYVDYSYFDAQVRCTYLVPNMTLTLMFNRNYNNLRYSIKKIKSLLEQKFFLLKSVCEFSLKHWQSKLQTDSMKYIYE